MSKIGVFGASGMLGGYVSAHLKNQGFDVAELARTDVISEIEALSKRLKEVVGQGGWIINCVGVIKPQIAVQGPVETIRVNALFPHVLANAALSAGIQVIHITTDCVFSGKTGNYTEKSFHDAVDLYGRSKSLGEPENCLVIRTSIIGEEKNHKRSLIEWAKSETGNQVRGFTNHTWNGVTCLQFAKIAEQIIKSGPTWNGVRHVYSPNSVNKLELMQMINDAFNLDLKISAFETPDPVHRTLKTDFPEICSAFKVPDLKDQLAELKAFTW
jgi:dTDP-4-dehydrorhamnose reductase